MQILSIIYRLAVTFWVGGVAIFTFVLTPIIFKVNDRDTAGTDSRHPLSRLFPLGTCLRGRCARLSAHPAGKKLCCPSCHFARYAVPHRLPGFFHRTAGRCPEEGDTFVRDHPQRPPPAQGVLPAPWHLCRLQSDGVCRRGGACHPALIKPYPVKAGLMLKEAYELLLLTY